MSDPETARHDPLAGEAHPPLRTPFPFTRLVYAFGFAVVGWLVFWGIIILAIAQFITLAIAGQANEELRTFTRNVVHYLAEILAYTALLRDEPPFPFGPFPKS